MEKKTVLITGTSSGYGKAIAKKFAAGEWNVIATMRAPEKEKELSEIDNVLVTRLDVLDMESVTKAIEKGINKFGKIDLLINNAAHGLVGVFEAISAEQIRNQFAVNVFGYMDIIREILPHFRENKKGMIINIGSQGGIITFPLMSPYHATKFALEGFTESLSYELATINVIVKLIEPGGANTSFFRNSQAPSRPVPPEYSRIINATGMNALFDKYKDKLSTPEEAATFIYHAATDGTDRFRYLIGEEMRLFLNAKKQESDEGYVHLMRSQFLPH